jgi:antitoxin component YwqK of YwqJK toxin-antitoxin module
MRGSLKVAIIFSLSLVYGCGSPGEGGVEVREVWPNGSPKEERINMGGDTVKVTTFHANFKINTTGKVVETQDGEVKHGEWKSFYPNGINWSLGNFQMGVDHGDYRTWHPNGQPNIIGHYTMGATTGKWQFLDSTGVVVKEFDSTPQN